MNAPETGERAAPSPSEYILDNFEPTDRIAVLVLNRQFHETTQRITTAEKAASPEFQAWLRYKNVNDGDIYVGMNALKRHASTRTKDDIEGISHVYLDLDYGGTLALDVVQNSDLVPRPNYVLNTSPEKFQIVWRVEGMTIDEAEALNQALVREFDGDPAATDSTRVLRLPGFANKKYEADFYVQARAESTQMYHLRDFKLEINSQDAPRHYELRRKQSTSSGYLSQSEHDWAYAKRALSRGDEPESVIQRIADFRAHDKPNPGFYARLTVTKAWAEIQAHRVSGDETRKTNNANSPKAERQPTPPTRAPADVVDRT